MREVVAPRPEKATKRMGASLVDFDPVSGVWKFKTPHFLSEFRLAQVRVAPRAAEN